MAFQREVGSGVNRAVDYRDLFNKKVTMMTSRHVATVAVNAAGSGWTTGDEATLTHAGAFLDAKFEVTASAGAITALRITSSGAFADRVATVAVNVGGTLYVVGDVVEIQGGTSREPGKALVDTVSGGVVTAISVFETGGVYSTPPGATGATTIGIGPSTFAGDDALTLDLTQTGIIGTTGLAVTGPGSAATVDITLAETGWTVDGRNVNNRDENSLDDEKIVVLVGDATGITNKPYVGFQTWTQTSGIDTRFGIMCFGMVAHNSAIAIHLQPILSPSYNTSTGALLTAGSHLLCDENQVQEMDFWITVDDARVAGVININPAAGVTDDGEYLDFYLGLMTGYGTEIEQPYPMLIGASSRALNINPSVASTSITSIAECVAPAAASTGWNFYEAETSVWRSVINNQNFVEVALPRTMYPMGFPNDEADVADPDNICIEGPIDSFRDWSELDRGAPSRRLLPVYSDTVPEIFLWPLNVLIKINPPTVVDGPRGEVRGFFWLSATNSAGAQIANFSEDFVTIGTDRYRVFHNHVHTERYQYIAILEDV